MTITQNNGSVNFDNPSSIDSLEQLNSSTQSSQTTYTQQPSESSKNTPLKEDETNLVFNAIGLNADGVSTVIKFPFITVKTTQTLVTAPSGSSGTPSAKPVVVDNKNLNLQPGLGINDIVDVILPYARAQTIRFVANKLKPNTKYYAFFNEYNVTEFCYTGNIVANIVSFSTTTMTSKLESQKLANVSNSFSANVLVAETGNIFSDYKGFVSGIFMFTPEAGLKIPSGEIIFRLTDSQSNGENRESFADAVYTSVGRLNRFVPAPKPPTTKPPTYGSGGNANGNPSLPTPGKGNSSTTQPTTDYGLLDHYISFLKNIPLTSITNTMRVEYYKDYTQTNGGDVFKSDVQIKAIMPGVLDYEMDDLIHSNNYNLVSGASAVDKNTKTSDGSRVGDNLTALNVLTAVNANTGKTLVQEAEVKIKSVGGNKAWDLAVSTYEGTVKATQKAVASGKLTPDMQKFWDTGVKTGQFNPNSQADIQKAINNYAAATTLSLYSQTTNKGVSAATAGKNNGVSPALKTATATKNNSTSTSTGKK